MTGSDKRIALVSGGSRGIGRAAVLRLVRDGFDVAFCYQSNADAARSVEKAAGALGGVARASQVDVTDPGGTADWVTAVERELGPVGAVVCSAGILRDGPLLTMRSADWSAVIDTNLTGTYNVCRPAVFGMLKRRSGCVVNLSSVAGVEGTVGQANYSAAKAGIIGFTKSLAKEVARYGVRANVVAPGFIETDMLSGMSEKAMQRAVGLVPLGRLGQPDEVADAVSYLVHAGYVTGTVLPVHGGIAG